MERPVGEAMPEIINLLNVQVPSYEDLPFLPKNAGQSRVESG